MSALSEVRRKPIGMNLILALDHRFLRTPDGSYWSATLYPYAFWSRYLSVFDRVSILARVHDTPTKIDSWKRVDGDRVSFASVPAYVGPWQFVQSYYRVRRAIRRADLETSAILLQLPGMVPSMVASRLRPVRPFGIEVIADPYDAFSRHAASHPLRPFLRWWSTRVLKRQCLEAACSLYVTEHALQNRYPPTPGHFSVSASDADMQDAAYIDSIAAPADPASAENTGGADTRRGARFRLIHVGTLEALYKAPDVLVAAFAQAVGQGLDGELAMIGDGRERPRIEGLAQRLGMGERVKFLGQLPGGDEIRRQLDASDLFVLPSRQEGMPRAMIEAMARGLPCIGTRVGGIPELLPDVALVPRNHVDALAAKILQFARDPKLRAEMARMNLRAARRYHESIMQAKRVPFYEHLAAITREWQKSQGIMA
jgi:glycosyltransferase involved in cell wall biosynthesis